MPKLPFQIVQVEAKDRRRPRAALMLTGFFITLGSLLIPAWQTMTWLHHRLLPALPLRTTWRAFGWPFFRTDSIDMQRALLWVFDLPTTLVVFIVGIVVFAYGLRITASSLD
jgi:hypothetical protein